MVALINGSAVVSRSEACIECRIGFGSAEKPVPGVRDGKEGPKHVMCASETERRLAVRRYAAAGNGSGASNQ